MWKNHQADGKTPASRWGGLLKRCVPATVMVLALIAPASAGQKEDNKKAQRADEVARFQDVLPLAKKGDVDAQHYIGSAYSMGRGVPQDSAEAAKWFRRAADQGDPRSQQYLGLMYSAGRGVPQDYVEAYVWLTLSGSNPHPGWYGDSILKIRDDLAQKLTPEELVRAKERVKKRAPSSP